MDRDAKNRQFAPDRPTTADDALYIVSSPSRTAGLRVKLVDGWGDVIVEAPPILAWMTGKPLATCLAWLAANGYVIVQKIKD